MQSLWFNNYFPVSQKVVILLRHREYAGVLCVLLNITSCSYFVTTLQFSGGKELDLELVSCSGYGKNGALSVLQVL